MNQGAFTKVEAVWGRTDVRIFPPGMKSFKDVVFIPNGFDGSGIYTENGVPIREGFPVLNPYDRPKLDDKGEVVTHGVANDDGCYIYGGHVLAHYGHALLSTLSRYWFCVDKEPEHKILYHGPHPFDLPYMRFWLEGCGLKSDAFLSFSEVTCVRQLFVPEPSFEELHRGSAKFANMCQVIAKNTNSIKPKKSRGSILYVSKSRVSAGVSSIVNENEIEFYLKKYGIDVVYPEMMSLSDQIGLFYEYESIIGTACSAMHTSVFVAGGCNMSILTYQDVVHGNYILIDKIAKNKTSYFYAESDQLEGDGRFGLMFRLRDPEGCAAHLLRCARGH